MDRAAATEVTRSALDGLHEDLSQMVHRVDNMVFRLKKVVDRVAGQSPSPMSTGGALAGVAPPLPQTVTGVKNELSERLERLAAEIERLY